MELCHTGGVNVMYDVLGAYRGYLMKSCRLRPETARTYTNRLENLFEGQDIFYTVEKLDISKILDKLSAIKYKNYYSQSKNAFLYFLKFQKINLNEKQREKIEFLENNTHKKYRKHKKIVYQDVQKKIKHLRNTKLKLCYQTLLETGLRVSELSQITTSDCKIFNEEIYFSFIGKGGNKEVVLLKKQDNSKLYGDLKKKIEETALDKKIFYSAIYLQKNSIMIGCRCHDLRRICAKLEYKKTKSKESVMKKLRHTNIKTTDIYLKSKITI